MSFTRDEPNGNGRLEDAISKGDARWVSGFINGRLGIEVQDAHIEKWLKSALKIRGWWSEGTWVTWFKNRMEECGYFAATLGRQETNIRLGCELHCFFIGIHETEEMLARIMTPDETADRQDRIARSKIGKTQLKDIYPIDANAAAVVSKEFQRN